MAGSYSRNKGKRGEREIVDMLQPIVDDVYTAYGLDVPKLKRNSLQSDEGGEDISGLEWLAIEVKYHENPNVPAFWRQTLEQAGITKTPVLFYRRSKQRWSVMMRVQVYMTPDEARTTDVVVDTSAFAAWFRLNLATQLEKQGYCPSDPAPVKCDA
jgi:hypothetical protein